MWGQIFWYVCYIKVDEKWGWDSISIRYGVPELLNSGVLFLFIKIKWGNFDKFIWNRCNHQNVGCSQKWKMNIVIFLKLTFFEVAPFLFESSNWVSDPGRVLPYLGIVARFDDPHFFRFSLQFGPYFMPHHDRIDPHFL